MGVVLTGTVTEHLQRVQVLVSEFEGWSSVRGNPEIAFDWDDAVGNAARRAAGIKLEAMRNAEIRRRRLESRGGAGAKTGAGGSGGRDVARLMPKKGQTTF